VGILAINENEAYERMIELQAIGKVLRKQQIERSMVSCDCGFTFMPFAIKLNTKSGITTCDCVDCGELVCVSL